MAEYGSNMSLLDRLESYTEGEIGGEGAGGVILDGFQRDALLREYGTGDGFQSLDEAIPEETAATGYVLFDRENQEAAYASSGRVEGSGEFRVKFETWGDTQEVVNELRENYGLNAEIIEDSEELLE